MANKKLSATDRVFLLAESPDTPMHIAGLMQFELPDDADQGFVADVVKRFRACTVFRRPWNLQLETPRRLQTSYMMREVHDVDMEYHVRHHALPYAGGERELGQLIARLHSQPLNLRKPLWECHVIEGLDQNRFAIYIKMHHVLADGVSASQMMISALASDPAEIGQLPFWATGFTEQSPKHAPKKDRRFRLPRLKPNRGLLEALGQATAMWTGGRKAPSVNLSNAPDCILNGRISPERRFATHAEPLDRLKRIAKAADASLNDVVLGLTGTAVRDYLIELNALPTDTLTASIPVSLREAGDNSGGNEVSMMFAALGTNIADDRARLEAIKCSASEAKDVLRSMSPAAAKAYPNLMFLPLVAASLLDAGGRGKPPFNVVVSNVPGGKKEKYLYGARLANLYPVNIPMHGMAFNVTCYSHAGTVNFGLIACRDSVPQVQRIAVGLKNAVERLEKAYNLSSEDAKHLAKVSAA